MEYMKRMRTKASPVKLLDRVLAPIAKCLTPTAAKELAKLKADRKTRARMAKLAAKSDAGVLTPAEQAEYRFFIEVGDFVAVLQAKARRYLAEHSTR